MTQATEQKPMVIGADQPRRTAPRRDAAGAWSPLLWFGMAVLLVGLADLALVWYPIRAENPAWEFGAIDRSVATTPVLLVGLGMIIASALSQRRRWVLGLVGAVGAALALLSLVGLFVYWTAVPLALSGTPEPALAGIYKSMIRTSIFGLILLGASAASAVVAFRVVFTQAERTGR